MADRDLTEDDQQQIARDLARFESDRTYRQRRRRAAWRISGGIAGAWFGLVAVFVGVNVPPAGNNPWGNGLALLVGMPLILAGGALLFIYGFHLAELHMEHEREENDRKRQEQHETELSRWRSRHG